MRSSIILRLWPGHAQKDMLEDHKRTGAYYQAVMQNRRQFEGKVVLDVGTGSGILALFAAKAGARKVYAVEATSMAKFARILIEHHGVRIPYRPIVQRIVTCMHVPCVQLQRGSSPLRSGGNLLLLLSIAVLCAASA